MSVLNRNMVFAQLDFGFLDPKSTKFKMAAAKSYKSTICHISASMHHKNINETSLYMFLGTRNTMGPLFSSFYVYKFKIWPEYAQNVVFTIQKCENSSWFWLIKKLTSIWKQQYLYCISTSWKTNNIQSSCVFLHSWLLYLRHLHVSMHGKRNFRQLHSLLRHPVVHPHDIISEHDFGIGGRESNCGNNCPSVRVQPISVTNGRTGIGEFAWNHILVW